MLRLDYIPLSFRDRISPYFGSFPCLFGRPSIYDQSDCQSQLGWEEHVWLSRRMRLQPKRRIFLAQSIAGRHALQNFELLHKTHAKTQKSLTPEFPEKGNKPLADSVCTALMMAPGLERPPRELATGGRSCGRRLRQTPSARVGREGWVSFIKRSGHSPVQIKTLGREKTAIPN